MDKLNKIETVFGRKKVLLPVVHVIGIDQMLRNVSLAIEAGADGVFLINHNIKASALITACLVVRERFNNLWVGVNFLDLWNIEAAQEVLKLGVQGFWVDDAGVYEDLKEKAFSKEDLLGNWNGLYFGGVAFKYQREVKNVARVAKLAVGVVDVITTSGIRTGSAPDILKIKSMKEAIGNVPLAIASGVTPDNVEDFLSYCDCFLVATGISDSHTELNFEKTKKLAYLIHSYQA